MSKKVEFFGNLLLMVVAFFSTVYVSVPIIQSIWKMLVSQYYPNVVLYPGVIIFCLIISALLHMKPSEKAKTLAENCGNLFTFYVVILTMWGMAYLYSLAI